MPPSPQPASFEDSLKWVSKLTPEQRAALEESIQESTRALWAPSPGPQARAYFSEADEVYYGGAAGGGKSQLIIGLALTAHRRSLILRRESTQLRGMIDDIARTLGTRDGLNRQDGQWRIPPAVSPMLAADPGSEHLIEFGGVPNPGDEERHQGIPHDLLAIDEATQVPEYVIDYLSTWNRTTTPGQRTRLILTSNPPTPSTQYNQNASSGLWVLRRYAAWLDPRHPNPAKPGELRWFVTLDGREMEHPDGLPFWYQPLDPLGNPDPHRKKELVIPKSRTFIPARVSDNPFLSATSYESTLQKLPEPLRSAMLYGDFSVTLTDQPYRVFPTEWLREANRLWETLNASPQTHKTAMTSLGVDVARGGVDSTVVIARHGNFYAKPHLVPTMKARTGPQVAAEVLALRRDGARIVVDANGVGASVYDHATENMGLTPNEDIVAYVGSVASTRRDASGKLGFFNKRSEVYWLLRESLDPASSYKVALPPDDELFEELSSMTWKEQSGKIKIIPKEDLAKLLGRSPDKADALSLAHTVRDEENDPRFSSARTAREERLADAGGRWRSRRARWGDNAADLPYPRGI